MKHGFPTGTFGTAVDQQGSLWLGLMNLDRQQSRGFYRQGGAPAVAAPSALGIRLVRTPGPSSVRPSFRDARRLRKESALIWPAVCEQRASVFYKPRRARARQNPCMKPNIIPIVQYTHATAAVEWLVRALGFTRQRVEVAANDAVSRAELRFGASPLVVNSASAAVGPWSDVRLGLHVCTPDLAETTTIRDPEGYLWSRGPGECGPAHGDADRPERRHRGHLAPGAPDAPNAGRFEAGFRAAVVSTIYGGSSEILREIIAERRLGLPRNRPNR